MMLKRIILVLVGIGLIATTFSPLLEAQQSPPTTAPAAATQPAQVSPEAQQVLDQMKAAYAKIERLTLVGTISGTFDVAGQADNKAEEFTTTFQAPNKFRHEMKDDVLIGSTGKTAYLYHPGDNIYITKDAKEGDLKPSDLPRPIADILQSQDPSLILAFVDDGGALLNSVTAVTKGQDVTIGDATYTSLQFESPVGKFAMLFDQATHLLRQMRLDLRRHLEAGGHTDVKAAEVVIDYTKTDTEEPVDAAQFAWAPPDGATDLSQQMAAGGGGGGGESELKGQPAPDFTLKDLDDKDVKLSELKGNVVLLDFWATWCGPCVASMPHLQKVHEEKAAEGLKVYAVNLQEEKAQVSEFLKSKNLTLPVLMDTDGAVGQQYGVQGIPFTLVIGKDGVVKEVMVGFNEQKLHDALESAMAE